MKTNLVQKNSNGKIKFIEMRLGGDSLARTWGLLGGKTQGTANTYDFINQGKANELTPIQAAQADHDRILKRKIKEGYMQVDSLDDLSEFEEKPDMAMDFNILPTQFCCSKPKSKISDTALLKLIAEQKARCFIKYNGLCHYILIDTKSNIKIYTRRMDDHTRKYPLIVRAVEDMKLPPETLLITEFVIDPSLNLPHMTSFKLMSSISKSDTVKGVCKDDMPKTIARQKEHQVRACVFGILYWQGEEVWRKSAAENLVLQKSFLKDESSGGLLFLPEELDNISFGSLSVSAIRFFAKNNKEKYEGLVVWDMAASMEITFNGKPKRRAAFKIKEVSETDVIAYDYLEGTGKLQGKIGSLKIGKYDSTGKLIDLGTVGSGLQPKSGDCEIDKWVFPCVVEIQYDQIFPDTGKFQFPRFVKIHEDKLPADVDLAA